MRATVAVILAVLTLATLTVKSVWETPKSRVVYHTVYKTVTETRVRKVPIIIIEDGVERTEYRDEEFLVYPAKAIREESTVPPTQMEKLRFWCTAAVASIFGMYTLFVLGLWMRDKLHPARANADREDTRNRLDTLIKFSSGVLLGVISAGPPSIPEGLMEKPAVNQVEPDEQDVSPATSLPPT